MGQSTAIVRYPLPRSTTLTSVVPPAHPGHPAGPSWVCPGRTCPLAWLFLTTRLSAFTRKECTWFVALWGEAGSVWLSADACHFCLTQETELFSPILAPACGHSSAVPEQGALLARGLSFPMWKCRKLDQMTSQDQARQSPVTEGWWGCLGTKMYVCRPQA